MRTRHTKEAVLNLDQQKKQARELLRAIRAGNEDAISRLRRHHSRWTSSDDATVRQLVALHDAQFVLAREQGFASWPKLKAYAEPSSAFPPHAFVRRRCGLDHRPGSWPVANAPIRRPGGAGTDSRMASALCRSNGRGDSTSSIHRGRRPPGLRAGARLRDLGRPDQPREPLGIQQRTRPPPNRSWRPSAR